jgi:hypothetical protein
MSYSKDRRKRKVQCPEKKRIKIIGFGFKKRLSSGLVKKEDKKSWYFFIN